MIESAAQLGCGATTILRRLRLFGIPVRPRGPSPHRETSGLAWSPAVAYAVGLIATDGNLSRDGRHISVVSKDLDLLETLCRCLGLRVSVSEPDLRPPIREPRVGQPALHRLDADQRSEAHGPLWSRSGASAERSQNDLASAQRQARIAGHSPLDVLRPRGPLPCSQAGHSRALLARDAIRSTWCWAPAWRNWQTRGAQNAVPARA